MHFRLEQGSNVVLPFKSGKKFSTGGKRKTKTKTKMEILMQKENILI